MSKREEIRDYVINCLATIKQVNGYENDVKKVTKYLSDTINIRSYPILCVFLGDEQFQKQGEILYERTLNLYIIGFTQVSRDLSDSGKLIDANESLITDVLRCLNINESGLISTLKLVYASVVYVAPYLQFSDQGQVIGNIEIQYQVKYVS